MLLREAELLGPAVVSARLYDLGDYPAIVTSEDERDVVHGEVYALNDPDRTFRWLDPFETTEPGDPTPSDYTRLVRPVRLRDGSECLAWMYAYTELPEDAHWIECGSWAARMRLEVE